ncbi:dienelactone hydrolase family protein [Halovivax gelatinilyticus]|uniref:dienelactone hydrolase family protein n=1 Tax=Halovivax gelatinilyticus TaxID=2961597 RepID=UPI003CCDEA17
MSPDETNSVIEIPVDGVALEGELVIPPGASGLVVFAHGSGSSRHSPRNNAVAETLRERGLATLLFDLLTEAEDRDRATRFDIQLLTDRLVATTGWLRNRPETSARSIGYFGSSTGAAAALRGAARPEAEIDAVVSRGGRVDMAEAVLDDVTAPTRLIVGGDDESVRELNRAVYDRLSCEKSVEIVEGAGHLFDGPGELDEVADLAADLFSTHLG